MSKIEISLINLGRRGGIVIDGNDIAPAVRGLRLNHKIGHLPELTLDLAMLETRLDAEHVKVLIPDATAQLLIDAGWTPPPNTDPCQLGQALKDKATQ